MACVEFDRVERLALGDLGEGELAELRAHAETCEICAARLAEATLLDGLLAASFREVGAWLRPQRDRVLARIGEASPILADAGTVLERPRAGASAPPSGRTRSAAAEAGSGPRAPEPQGNAGAFRRARFFGKRARMLFIAMNAIAASLLVLAYGGYLALLGVQRQALQTQARTEVRNIVIVLRALHERREAPTPEAAFGAAVARLNLAADPFGNPFRFEQRPGDGFVYCFGPNGRDERGGGDDIAAYVR